MTTATISRNDIYSRVTNRIIEDLEMGVRPWFKPWTVEPTESRIGRGHRLLRRSGTMGLHGCSSPEAWMLLREWLSALPVRTFARRSRATSGRSRT